MTQIILYALAIVPWIVLIAIALLCYFIKSEIDYIRAILDIQNEQILYLNKKIEECKDDKK